MKKQKFQDWEYSQINKEFGLKRFYRNFPPLDKWLDSEVQISKKETERLVELKESLFINVEAWNEDELKFFFLSQLISLVNFQTEHYKPFTQRKMSAVIGDWEVSGVVDFVVSKGEQHPEQPFFFLHEYKQERRRDNDPLGQLLIEMLVAKELNEQITQVFGCYVVGRNHFFVVLCENEYAVSDAFIATSDDIFGIFKALSYVKHQINEVLKIKN
jgi:hypothetical protein